MKTFLLLTCGVALLSARAVADFTNNIRIVGDVFLGVTDDLLNAPKGTRAAQLASHSVLEATNDLTYIVRNTGTNYCPLYLRPQESWFDMSLTASNGRRVPKTALGKEKPPSGDTSIRLGTRARMGPILYNHGLDPGRLRCLSLPPVIRLFDIRVPGTYVLEMRLRHWLYKTNRYDLQLSDPIRLPVLVHPEDIATTRHSSPSSNR